ncbi:hypothetical protein PJI17_07475 [Mycobacterium kansasii]|uniref:Uncharacterized protein n=1 Tax=Mycobacterium kansasii TaxID=1768 RepID=A0A1V3WHF1_MYCKA|nr:hypothetical protein BZL30_8225 [Mycobacterium kansasii]
MATMRAARPAEEPGNQTQPWRRCGPHGPLMAPSVRSWRGVCTDGAERAVRAGHSRIYHPTFTLEAATAHSKPSSHTRYAECRPT